MLKIPERLLKTRFNKKKLLLLVVLILAIQITLFKRPIPTAQEETTTQTSKPEATTEQLNKVVEVIDGDTFKVDIAGKVETIRLIAVDTPETNHPTKPVQCFGYEAKLYMQSILKDKSVKLEREPKDNDRDVYGRLLRYVYLEDGTNVNANLVKNGYAFEKTYVEGYKYQELFKTSQKYAQENKLGLWDFETCNGNPNNKPLKPNTDITVPPPIYAPEVEGTTSQKYTCDCAKTCSKISSCAEAYFQLESCGCTARDDNNDGIPCTSICKKP